MTREIHDVRSELGQALCEAFAGESMIELEFNYDHFSSTFQQLMDTGFAKLWVAEVGGDVVGAIGGVQFPHLFNGKPSVMESFWYVHPDHRHGLIAMRLLRSLERWAGEIKAQHIIMAHLDTLNPERIGEFYEKQGYKRLETHYAKALWQ
jgi:GNAT superfamily N-acetyltransferase